ncbi:MAG: hypothetical protein IPL96_11620 [Holophagaceae bacterium]|nr:hypothetical protein [Holophagaceae bacterium]
MCGGLEFQKRSARLTQPELIEGVRGSGAGVDAVRVFFPSPKAAIRVAGQSQVDGESDLWLPWGRRKEEPGGWPEGGWARGESLAKAYWTRWAPAEVVIHPARWMEKDPARKSWWFEMEPGTGILCLRLDRAPGTPLYVVTDPATGDFAVEIHSRIPRIVQG